MSKARFLNQKLGKRADRKSASVKAHLETQPTSRRLKLKSNSTRKSRRGR